MDENPTTGDLYIYDKAFDVFQFVLNQFYYNDTKGKVNAFENLCGGYNQLSSYNVIPEGCAAVIISINGGNERDLSKYYFQV